MLRVLHIRNLAVIEEASIEFDQGLNVLSGSTGAGKSIVVDAMALVAGGRARSDLVRSATDELTLTAVFDRVPGEVGSALEEAGLELDDETLVVRREIQRDGPNRVYLDDRPVTLRLLAEIAPHLLRIHTQREELGLTSPELQRFWVDRAGGEEADGLLRSTAERYREWAEIEEKRRRLAGDERLRLERIDLLRFQRREIDAAGLERGEEVELGRRRDELRHHEAIQAALGGSFERLSEREGAAVEALAASERLLSEIERWQPEASEWLSELRDARIRIQEVSAALRDRLDAVGADPGELDAVEERLATIDRLARKYGDSTNEILDHHEGVVAELAELESSEEDREALEQRSREALESYRQAAEALSAARHRWGATLVEGVERELADLAMGRARLDVAVEPVGREESPLEIDGRAVDFGPEGFDRVTLMLQTNPDQERGPLARVASGGELSRIYLALQLAAREASGERPTLIFDEVDAGIGGSEAAALGSKLRRLSEGGQILAVTHLPQVASSGHQHFLVTKSVEGGDTRVAVERLEAVRRVDEVARMLSGEEVTSTSRSHAEQLIAAATEAG